MRNVRYIYIYIYFVIKYEIQAPQGSDRHQYKKEVKLRKEIIIEKKKNTTLRDMLIHFLTVLHSRQLKGKDLKEQTTPKTFKLFTHFLFVISQSNNTRQHIPFFCPETLNVYKRKENHMTLVVNSTESLTCKGGEIYI